MALRRRQKREMPRAGPFPPGWDVPAAFNFTRDVVEAYAKDPIRSALTFVDHEGIVDRRTYAEVARDAARWAHLLRTRLDRGDRVLIVVGKVPAWHGAMLGAIKGGLVAVPCPSMLRARDLAFRVRHSGSKLVIADRECEPEVEEMRNQIGDIVPVLYVDEAQHELMAYMPVAPTEETTAGETALILYTSGTTKEPKGVVHTHAYTWAQRMQAAHWLDAHERDVVWCTAGTGWAKAIWNVLLGPWSHGAEIVLHESAFEPEQRLALLQRLGVTVLCQAPTEYRMLAKVDRLATTYLPKLRHAVSAGEPLNPEVITRFQDALGLTVHDGYGQTENSLLVANIPGVPVQPGSMGLPTEGHDVAVIDESGAVCAPGVEGDIALLGRPPTLFTGYWNDRDETNAVFRDDWYVTGDRAVRDEQGYLWFVGRNDDVILSAAYRIGPFEVESALLEHAAVAESAVVGVPDDDRGQIVKAFVVLRPGHEPGEQLAVELQDHVKAITAPYKYPRAISFVEELPKTTSGKIRRGELREVGIDAEEFTPAPAVSLRAVPDLEVAQEQPDAAEAERLEAEAAARREGEAAEQAAAAAAAEEARVAAEAAARQAAEEAERARVEAEEAARRQAEEDERLRAEAEAAEQARLEAEERARAEAEEQARREAEEAEEAERHRAEQEAAERARAEAEAAEQARLEAEETARREAEEQARAEAEAAERARLEAEELERARAEAEAAERARLRAEETARREAEAQARADAEAAEHARLEAEELERARAAAEAAALALAEPEVEPVARPELEAGAAEVEEESQRDARRRKREEAARLKAEAEEAKRRAKAEAEQRKRDDEAAREAARRREIEEKAAAKQRALDEKLAAKQRAEDEKRREADEKLAAKQRAEDEKRREAEEKLAAKQFAEDEKRRAKEREEQRKRDEAAAREEARRREAEEKAAAKQAVEAERRKRDFGRPRRGLGRLLPRDEIDDDYGSAEDDVVEPIPDLVERLQRYSGAAAAPSNDTDGHVSNPDDDTPGEPEHLDERRSAP